MKHVTIKTASIVFILFLLHSINIKAQDAYGEIRGIIKDEDLKTIPYATIKITQAGVLVGGTQTDDKGRYKYKPLSAGLYEMTVMEAEHQTLQVSKIKVIPNQATYVDLKLSVNTLTTVTVTAKKIDYTQSGVEKTMYSMQSISAEELMQNASVSRGDIKNAVVAVSSDVVQSANGDIHVRGARPDATAYYIDGNKTLSANQIPGLAIENLTFFSGGVPAMYGDLTSGAIIVTTKSYFSGLREKNMRNTAYREKIQEKKDAEKAKKDEETRKKEIEEEKLLEK
jgi:hypothetical protein